MCTLIGDIEEPIDDLLPAHLVPGLRCQQEAWKEQMAAQDHRGGTVNSNVVALSLSSMPPEAPPSQTVTEVGIDLNSKSPHDAILDRKNELITRVS